MRADAAFQSRLGAAGLGPPAEDLPKLEALAGNLDRGRGDAARAVGPCGGGAGRVPAAAATHGGAQARP